VSRTSSCFSRSQLMNCSIVIAEGSRWSKSRRTCRVIPSLILLITHSGDTVSPWHCRASRITCAACCTRGRLLVASLTLYRVQLRARSAAAFGMRNLVFSAVIQASCVLSDSLSLSDSSPMYHSIADPDRDSGISSAGGLIRRRCCTKRETS